jgi:hypothetical protein
MLIIVLAVPVLEKREVNSVPVKRAEGVDSTIEPDNKVGGLIDPKEFCEDTTTCPAGQIGDWSATKGGHCFCKPRKAMSDNLQTGEGEGNVPGNFDPRVYCLNQYKCPPGQYGHWDNVHGGCFCARRKAMEASLELRDINNYCQKKKQCPSGQASHWNETEGQCCCPQTKVAATSSAQPATADFLTSRLLPQPIVFPTKISAANYTAMEVTLVVLDGEIKTQDDLHKVCTGEKDLQAFGFTLSIFQKAACTPEIVVPVPSREIDKASMKIYTAQDIDTRLQHYNGDFTKACKSLDAQKPSSTLDGAWERDILCKHK